MHAFPIFKDQIFYARTYRHLRFQLRECLTFTLLLVMPLTVVFLFFYDELTVLMVSAAAWFLGCSSGIPSQVLHAEFIPALGQVAYLSLDGALPSLESVLLNMAAVLLLTWLLTLAPFRGKPLSVYLEISLFVHLTACVFFLLGKDIFPYSLTDYSRLYSQQQVGIWLAFLILMGLVQGILGRGSVLFRLAITAALLLYSFFFGILRYCLFLWILRQCSLLYLPVMFFTLGPAFDFLYFVMFYALSANPMIRKNENRLKNDWAWS